MATAGGTGVQIFTRQSSGLVRQVSTVDTMWYSLVQVAVQFFFLIMYWWTLYPGSSMEIATLFVTFGLRAVQLRVPAVRR